MEQEDLLDDDWDDNLWPRVVEAASQVDEEALLMVTYVQVHDGARDFHLVDEEALWTWNGIGDHRPHLGLDFSVNFCFVGGGPWGLLQHRGYGTCDWEVLAVLKVHRELAAVEDGPSCGPMVFDLEDLHLVFSIQTVLDLQCWSEVAYYRAECADVCPSVEFR